MPNQPKMPFLTPSPSPHLCVAKNRNDTSPPAKKQRFSSPSPPQARTKPIPKSLPSTAKIPETIDYVKERHAAMIRLFDVWSSLAERYAKPIDEDDIVDIVTGKIVQDRGVVSSWDESTKGFFTGVGERKKKGNASKTGDRTQQREKEGAEEEGGERREDDGGGTDELDSFATEDVRDDAHGEVKLRSKPVVIVPHLEAEDNITPVTDRVLEELTEVEKRRKELYNDEVHSSDEDLEAYRVQLLQFRTPSSARPPPASSRCASPDEDDDLEIYQAQLRQFRSTAKSKSKICADDGCLTTENRSECRQIPSSSAPTTIGLDDFQTCLHQFRTPRPRYKQKWRVIVDSDDEFPPLEPKSRPSTPPIPLPPSSPAASSLADYWSDSPATLPPPSSSPVLLPLEDGSDDELYGWDLE
ncbi:hypothetical protein APHAL10511_002540 [Amanita phalloides]|nr:hypothetical protein APHAL10511_002540 [Amanita phalloides]